MLCFFFSTCTNVESIDFFFQQIWFDLIDIQLKILSVTYSILIKLLVLS